MQSKISMCLFVVIIMFSSFRIAKYWRWKELKNLGEMHGKNAKGGRPNLRLVQKNIVDLTKTTVDEVDKDFIKEVKK